MKTNCRRIVLTEDIELLEDRLDRKIDSLKKTIKNLNKKVENIDKTLMAIHIPLNNP